jgi:hypothetical protein
MAQIIKVIFLNICEFTVERNPFDVLNAIMLQTITALSKLIFDLIILVSNKPSHCPDCDFRMHVVMEVSKTFNTGNINLNKKS